MKHDFKNAGVISLLSRLKNHTGYSVVELLVAGGLAALIIGLSVQPIVQMRQLEKKVEFQNSLTSAHQIALQKARNSSFIKSRLINPNSPPEPPGLVEGNTLDRCFGGRGTGCATITIPPTAPATIDTFYFSQHGHGATSTVKMWVDCQPTKCGVVTLLVSTLQDGYASAGALEAQFSIPAAALSSRQEIDFSGCVGKAITGINYENLTAECVGFSGTNTCATIAAAGPMQTFAQGDPTDPANCQPPVNTTCPDGMGAIGLINGQTQCAPPVVCTDPMSTACGPPATLPPACVPNWQPLDSAVCLGQAFVQTDLNACGAPPQNLVGTNPALCVPNSCNHIGTIKWPNALTGPCENTAVNLTTPAGSTGGMTNTNLGYHGALTVTCVDGSPAPSNFDWVAAQAAATCAPITCSVPATQKWNSSLVFDGSPGPWDCEGPFVSTPSSPLLATQANPAAQATAGNTAATATAGSLTATCSDPGPLGAPRVGNLAYGSPSCTPLVSATCWLAEDIIVSQGASGPCDTITFPGFTGVKFKTQIECIQTAQTYPGGIYVYNGSCPPGPLLMCHPVPVADASTCSGQFNLSSPPPVVNGACGPASGAAAATPPAAGLCSAGTATPVAGAGPYTWSCDGSGGGTNASCATTATLPACYPDGWYTFSAGGWPDDTPCSSAYGNTNQGTHPNPLCCAGAHTAMYTLGDTVGGGNCNWVCGNWTPAAINGVCGAASGVPAATPPAAGLCNAGTATAVTGSNPYIWNCTGISGGSTANCASASVAPLTWQFKIALGTTAYGCPVDSSCPPTSGSCTILGATKIVPQCGCDKGPGEWLNGRYQCE